MTAHDELLPALCCTKVEFDSSQVRLVRRYLIAVFASASIFALAHAESSTLEIRSRDGESWWVGIISQGHLMPLAERFEADLVANTYGNQVQPLLLSSQGRGIWCEQPFQVVWREGVLTMTSNVDLEPFEVGSTLKEAYLYASKKYFPPAGRLPHEMLFTRPQYNTWIELMYDQNQDDILRYARDIIDQGFPPGVLMIDDNWQEDYGKWKFHSDRFPNPKGMMEELHSMGFKVMLWICPFVSPDCDVYRELDVKGALLREQTSTEELGPPKMVRWWNGVSAVLDLSNPIDEAWIEGQLQYLHTEYQVDGFKLDAGDAEFYVDGHSHRNVSPNEQSRLFGQVGLDYPLNEYRAMWLMGGQPLVQRLRDKGHSWEDLRQLIPQMSLAGLMGYPFCCPDMIGGGEFQSFLNVSSLDQELIVRSAQCHALMPMMQFSVAPWRILDDEHLRAVKAIVKLRSKFADYILETARKSAKTGEPVMRPMAYDYPAMPIEGFYTQFLIGSDLLVAPVVRSLSRQREVLIPPGRWQSVDGTQVKGPCKLTVGAPLDVLPYFLRVTEVTNSAEPTNTKIEHEAMGVDSLPIRP